MSEQEFRSIYKQYHKKLCYFLNYYTHDEQAIEEVVQDVFVYLWKESDNLNITYLKTYLYSSTRNRMLNYLRNEHTRTIILERWAQMELEERQAQDCIDRAEFFLLLQDTIEALPPKCREIFLMSRDERKTYKEIAEEKGISVKTVEAQMGIALKRKRAVVAVRLSSKFNKLWVMAEIMLFVLVGATVDLHYAASAGIAAVVLILGVLIFRMAGVWCCMLGTNLNKKERIFCMFAYMPKATVQAAIGGMPLAMGLSCGNIVLTVAVLSILITAPLGAFLIDATYRKLL